VSLRRSGDPVLAEVTRNWQETAAELQARELRADTTGFLFVVMAGYSASGILGPRADLFADWDRQAPPSSEGGGAAYPSFGERASALRVQLSDLERRELPFYTFGVRLLALGQHDLAIRL